MSRARALYELHTRVLARIEREGRKPRDEAERDRWFREAGNEILAAGFGRELFAEDARNWEWLADYSKPPESIDQETRKWILTRPAAVQALLARFPPDCVVKAAPRQTLACPAIGELAIVVSWRDDGGLSVCDPPGPYMRPIRFGVQTGWIEPVMYRPGFEPEAIKAVLDGLG